MNNPPVITIENISKLYLLYNKPQDRLKQSLFRPFGKNYARTFWALQDISLEVRQGQALGIVGRNGSGKSTLLQIIAGTLQPTRGTSQVKGLVTALLELGAGFNPEFTGRENIFLNGATLGFPEKQMRARMEEIIDFAELRDFIDQPVKIYSSGMFVRLAFAIATSINPDVLVIDEALAVGDAGFVIKCMRRMAKLREQGSTILLATHDVQTVRSFCDAAIWLDAGKMRAHGSPLEVTSQYIQSLFNQSPVPHAVRAAQESQASAALHQARALAHRTDLVRWGSGEVRVTSIVVNPANFAQVLEYGQRIFIEIEAEALTPNAQSVYSIAIAFRNTKGLDIITSTTFDQGNRLENLQPGQRIHASFDFTNILAPGDYALVVNIEDHSQPQRYYCDFIENAAALKVVSDIAIFSLVLPQVSQSVRIET